MTKYVYPTVSGNQNVTHKKVFLICETFGLSEESGETHYIDTAGVMWRQSSERHCKPLPVSLFQVCRITGDTENMIRFRFEQWKEGIDAARA